MSAALSICPGTSQLLSKYCFRLGRILGRFDLQGQLQGLAAVKAACRQELRDLEKDRMSRIRSYQTLGLCAGTALVILFL